MRNEKAVNEKVEFTPSGVNHTYDIIQTSTAGSTITVMREAGHVVLTDSYGQLRIGFPAEWAAHIGALVIAAGEAKDQEAA